MEPICQNLKMKSSMKTQKILTKQLIAGIVSFAFLSIVLISCSSESEDQVPAPTANKCEDSNVSLVNDIIPIVEQNCAVAGCHVSGTGRVDFTVKTNIISNASQIRTNTQAGSMPPASSGRSLTTAQKDEIFCWVTNGAKDN